jgi:F0F1-type ATP synthase assembly protein I
MTGPEQGPRPDEKQASGTDGGGTSPTQFAGLGLQFVIAMLGGLYAGQWLDRKLGTAPWLLMIGVFLGAGLSFYSMYNKLMKAQARDDAARKARRERQP